MLGPIIVDLGPEALPSERAIVLAACNEAVADGECLPETDTPSAPPRAVASARQEGATGVVRIQVRLGQGETASTLVRELRFERADPRRERWRSVGLAIATLVGEGQRREQEREQQAQEQRAESGDLQREAAEREQAEREQAEREQAERAAAPEPGGAAAPPSVAAPASSSNSGAIPVPSGVLLGIGGLAAPALSDGGWRIGGSLRGAWVAESGWLLCASLAYSERAFGGDGYSASWLSLEAGGGYRFAFTERLSSAISLQAGLQRLHLAATLQGLTASENHYNPSVSLGVDLWWLALPPFGFWAALDAHTIGRKSELYVRGARTVSALPVEGVIAAGVGWRIR